MKFQWAMGMVSVVLVILLLTTVAEGNVVPQTVTIKAPAVSVTITSANTYQGINLTKLSRYNSSQVRLVPFEENVTANSSIVRLGPVCTPKYQEKPYPPYAVLSLYPSNDTVDLVTGNTCYATVNLANFFWNFANATYGTHVSLGSGSAEGLVMAYQAYIGQLRFFSRAEPTFTGLQFLSADLNLMQLNLTPVMPFGHEYGDPIEAASFSPCISVQCVYSPLPTGDFDVNTTYDYLPFATNTTYSYPVWSLSISKSFCNTAGVATSCGLWWGEAQMLFYSPVSPTSTNSTGLCTTTYTIPSLIIVTIAAIAIITAIEYLGRPEKSRRY